MSIAPRLLVISDRHQTTEPLEHVLTQAAQAGAPAIYLRERDLVASDRDRLLDSLIGSLGDDRPLILTPPPPSPTADGAHLSEGEAWHPGPGVRGRSIHSVAAAEAANDEQLDYVIAAPVFDSASKPGRDLLGLDGLRSIADASRHPVLALSGIEPHSGQVQACLEAGASGIAVMGCVMRASEPADLTRALLDEIEQAIGVGG